MSQCGFCTYLIKTLQALEYDFLPNCKLAQRDYAGHSQPAHHSVAARPDRRCSRAVPPRCAERSAARLAG